MRSHSNEFLASGDGSKSGKKDDVGEVTDIVSESSFPEAPFFPEDVHVIVLTGDNLCGGRSPVRSVPGHPLGERQLENIGFQ